MRLDMYAPLKPQNISVSVEKLQLVDPDKMPDLSLVSWKLYEREVWRGVGCVCVCLCYRY